LGQHVDEESTIGWPRQEHSVRIQESRQLLSTLPRPGHKHLLPRLSTVAEVGIQPVE